MSTTLLAAEPASAAFAPKNRPYDAQHYKLTVRLNAATGDFHNEVEMRFKPKESVSEIVLDSENLKINGVTDGSGAKLNFVLDAKTHELKVSFPAPLAKDQETSVTVSYSGKAGLHHDGFFKVQDPEQPKRLPSYFTHFEAVSARKFFPCNDEPHDKATTEVIAETDEAYQILSNGKKVSEEVIPVDKKKKIRRVHWLQDKPHSTYLVNVVFGQFDLIEATAGNVPMKIYVAPGRGKDAEFAMDVLKTSMGFLQSFYNVFYPWNGYSMVGIPTFLWGGMENTTLTSMRESVLVLEDPSAQVQKLGITSVVTHELAHQWFGDYVTMKWWDDIWLNEAFASYMETLASADHLKNEYASLAAVNGTWEDYFRQEDGPRSHPIVSDFLPSPDDAFDSTNYTKGEHVLKMLDYYIGREAFKKGLNAYILKNALGNATYKDFFAEMEKASKQNLKGFVEGWLLKRGYPVISVGAQWDEEKKKLFVVMRQKPNHSKDSVVFDVKVPVSFHRRSGSSYDVNGSILLNQSEVSATFDLPAEPEWYSWNVGGVVLGRFETSRIKDETLALQVINDPDAVSRLAASFDLVKPWIDREEAVLQPLRPAAKSALGRFLEGEASPYVKSFFLTKLIDSKWAKLPADLNAEIMALASEIGKGKDQIGNIMVQARAITLLGKTNPAGTKELLEKLLDDTTLPLDLVRAAASGMAFLGDKDSTGVLKDALAKQGKRGWPFRKSILMAFASMPDPKIASELLSISKGPDANNEVIGGIFARLQDNEILKNSSEGAGFVRDFLLKVDGFNEQLKSRALQALEEAKAPAVKPALEEIVQKTESERLRTLAKQILTKNF